MTLQTERLDLRPTEEQDRERFVQLFTDDEFMVYSGGTLEFPAATERFDTMLERAVELPFMKQPVIERSSGNIVGYAGVNRFDWAEQEWLEFGWRLVPEARGHGYATEAVTALIELAHTCWSGEIIAMIDPRNAASAHVADKAGFTFWQHTEVNGWMDDIWLLKVGDARPG